MSTYAHLARAASTNLSFDLLRRNNIAYLEQRVIDLSAEYKALKATNDPRAAEVGAEGRKARAQLDRAVASERMGAE